MLLSLLSDSFLILCSVLAVERGGHLKSHQICSTNHNGGDIITSILCRLRPVLDHEYLDH